MKHINIRNKVAAAVLASTMLLTACDKKVLDVGPYASIPFESAFSTPAQVELSMNGVYDAGQSGFYSGGAVRGYPFGAANIEQGDMRGEDMLNQALFYQITYEATYNSGTLNNNFMFFTLYNMINKANLMVEGSRFAGTNTIITDAAAKQYEAEARFLRAMAHHELVINFARPYADGNGAQKGIIYRDFPITDPASIEAARSLTRETVAQNYTKILADLDFAETNLPATGAAGNAIANGFTGTYRATKAAAIALKMRVKMHMRDWAGVITEGNKLVPAAAPFVSPIGGWALTSTPEGPFANNLSTESIFSIRNNATDNPGVNGALAPMYGNPNLGGRGLVRVSPVIWSDADWKCSDLRRENGKMVDVITNTSGAITAVFSKKYRDITNSSDAAPQIRYAEVLLTLAEAEARQNGLTQRAVDLMNAVRNRSVLAGDERYTLASFADAKALITAILKERRIEFLAEGKRWGDIHRLALDADFAPIAGGGIPSKYGTGASVTGRMNCAGGVTLTRAVPAIPYSDFRFIWPIPLDETQQNPNFEQNPNY
ncbi:RagB/SusD family nutrient uptake outer membrane protein [Flavihumibacter rivuli]|uniref:RagB/SusD family nutrient uptake outer membrane protein n=1 Tax=Flavihumibacter rivuli TaxID=2838156 RepID=UPI001BDE84D6|nr:RagB/SusD family nutrient uptake outer membrane protein [Flavihumibacter rivuli]ULQ55106.1 RagB/SusD family nutrient uptake outer membrane protein [Flavihumibacter rivuli]